MSPTPTVRYKVWDPAIRLFHWALAGFFAAEALWIPPEETLHRQIGYVIVMLVGFRALWGVFGTRHARFSDFPPSASAALAQLSDMATGRRHLHLGHSPLGALMIYNLLVAMLMIGLSGWLMTTDALRERGWPAELHQLTVHWAELSVVAHVVAVVFESRRLRVNLARAMVTGYKVVSKPMGTDPE
ncbi:MAG: cytochrome b/b6 domain-containing protein [Paracoccaceae bacterium]|jgi:cytochrome b|nr:cytochrome b/b6 domain-containing protein [Paracoccaceae bacterium]